MVKCLFLLDKRCYVRLQFHRILPTRVFAKSMVPQRTIDAMTFSRKMLDPVFFVDGDPTIPSTL